ncbi:MAG: hemolysin III family protein [Candidatus Roizmanbacteria bacterium]|nr:hemolysin III family protein [Candidatus Roizmanbacteria bacterium]
MTSRDETSIPEEVFNSISHGVGALAGIVGFIFLMVHAHNTNNPYRFFGLLIFGVTLIILYLTSTLFHSLTFTKAYKVFKILDYSAIALFIAGSYTPIALVTLKNSYGLFLLIGVWVLTIIGVLWRIFGPNKENVSLILYLLTGWLLILFIKPLIQLLPPIALYLLFIGGASYTIGTIFFRFKIMPFNHGIWHLFVLGGSVCHFIMMMYL